VPDPQKAAITRSAENTAMRILQVTHYFGSHKGGIELVAEKLLRGLVKRRCEVTWAAANVTNPPSELASGSVLPLNTWNGVEATTGLPFPVPSVGALRKLNAQVRRSDLVLLHDCLYLSNIAALICARAPRVPVVLVQHTRMVPYRNRLLRAFVSLANTLITRRMLASAQQVVFISQNTARYFDSVKFRRPPAVVFNGVDTSIFRPLGGDENREEIRERLGQL
jgi:alpha-maltose-1-phosphate synthase